MEKKCILIAEDHVEMARRLQSLLSSDYEVDVVCHGAALLDAANTKAFDVIVTDITMPGIDGLEAAGRLLAAQPGSRIIFVTVRSEASVIRKAIAIGALGYVVKSDAGEELPEAVEAVLSGKRFLSTTASQALGDVNGG